MKERGRDEFGTGMEGGGSTGIEKERTGRKGVRETLFCERWKTDC